MTPDTSKTVDVSTVDMTKIAAASESMTATLAALDSAIAELKVKRSKARKLAKFLAETLNPSSVEKKTKIKKDKATK
jgi:hypothetical protein